MSDERIDALCGLEPHTHVILTPTEEAKRRMPYMDTDIDFYKVTYDKTFGESVKYGVSPTCDGYILPLFLVEDFTVVND